MACPHRTSADPAAARTSRPLAHNASRRSASASSTCAKRHTARSKFLLKTFTEGKSESREKQHARCATQGKARKGGRKPWCARPRLPEERALNRVVTTLDVRLNLRVKSQPVPVVSVRARGARAEGPGTGAPPTPALLRCRACAALPRGPRSPPRPPPPRTPTCRRPLRRRCARRCARLRRARRPPNRTAAPGRTCGHTNGFDGGLVCNNSYTTDDAGPCAGPLSAARPFVLCSTLQQHSTQERTHLRPKPKEGLSSGGGRPLGVPGVCGVSAPDGGGGMGEGDAVGRRRSQAAADAGGSRAADARRVTA